MKLFRALLRAFWPVDEPGSKQYLKHHVEKWWRDHFGRSPKVVYIIEDFESRVTKTNVIRFQVTDLGEEYEGVSLRSERHRESFRILLESK
jgi:hypothetical protein